MCARRYIATQSHARERAFEALADGTRLRILGLLLAGENCVCNLHESLAISQTKVSRHLATFAARAWSRHVGKGFGFTTGWLTEPALSSVRFSRR